ncbi:hypothetical protein [Actinoplanes sp. NPDC049316]|uniref:hypothetical protein n=1 Tax=Actinoplanes sp. NPDC049316 TaxID=3154727 RepID=UPI003438E3A8
MGLFIIVLMSVATVLLIRNMNKRLRRLPDSFPDAAGSAREAEVARLEADLAAGTAGSRPASAGRAGSSSAGGGGSDVEGVSGEAGDVETPDRGQSGEGREAGPRP